MTHLTPSARFKNEERQTSTPPHASTVCTGTTVFSLCERCRRGLWLSQWYQDQAFSDMTCSFVVLTFRRDISPQRRLLVPSKRRYMGTKIPHKSPTYLAPWSRTMATTLPYPRCKLDKYLKYLNILST